MFKLVVCRGGRGRGDRGRGRGDRGRGRGRGKEEKVMQFLETNLASLASCDDHLVLSWTKMITYGFIWSRTCEWDDNDGEFNSWNLYFNFPQEWIPVTKLGRLVKDGKIKSLEEIYLFSLPIKVILLGLLFVLQLRPDELFTRRSSERFVLSTCVLIWRFCILFVEAVPRLIIVYLPPGARDHWPLPWTCPEGWGPEDHACPEADQSWTED